MGKVKIRQVVHEYPWQILQARIDESIVTGQPLIENPFCYLNMETGQQYYNIYGCVGWPTEVSDKGEGMPGYAAVIGVIKPKGESKPQDAAFQLLAEVESQDIPTILIGMKDMREVYGFGLHPEIMNTWTGDPERYTTQLALENERLMVLGTKHAILIVPPDDFYQKKSFDHYVRSLHAAIQPGRVRLYFGGCEIIKNHLREFRRDNPAVFAIGGLVHSLLSRCMWMNERRENVFTVEDVENG